MANGHINNGYIPDSAMTTASGLEWTTDRRNGGIVQTPPIDRSSFVSDVGAGHNHGLASKLIKRNSNRRIPPQRQPMNQTKARLKKKAPSMEKISDDRLAVKPDNSQASVADPLRIDTHRSGDLREDINSFRLGNDFLERGHSSPNGSNHSQMSSNPNDHSSLDTNLSQNAENIFTVESSLPNGNIRRTSKPLVKSTSVGSYNFSNLDFQANSKDNASYGTKRKSIYERPQSASMEWRENTRKGPTYHYCAKETYFDCEFYIYGHKYQKDEKELLAPGVYEFPFAFNLPPNLPPSFSSEKGVIRYVVAAILDRPAAANLVRKKAFNIHCLLDLNMDPNAANNMSRSKTKNLCGLFCDTGPISLSARINKRAFVPGEKIIVNAEADNISGRSTKRTRLMLQQIITYMMPNNVKTLVEKRIINEIVRGIIPPGESDLWENVAITVPPMAPANLHLTARLLKVDYCIEMVMELPLPWKELRVNLPISIGSVPIRINFKEFIPQPEISEEKQPKLPKINYDEFPAYTFAECYFGKESLEEQYERLTGEKDDIGPQYETFHLFAPSYIAYTLGKMVHAPRMYDDSDTRPPTVTTRKGSKNGSLASKSSQARESSKLSGGSNKSDKHFKEKLALNVISKLYNETDRSRRKISHDDNAHDFRNVIIDMPMQSEEQVSPNEDDRQGAESVDKLPEKEEMLRKQLSKEMKISITDERDSFDFDRSEGSSDKPSTSDGNGTRKSDIEKCIETATFIAKKVVNKGGLVSNKDFLEDGSITSP